MDRINYADHSGSKAHPNNLPLHIAVIMDGNGRWAKLRNLSRTKGHRKGVESARDVIFSCQEKGIKVLTLFAFGVENWKRPPREVRNLFRIFFLVLRKEISRLHEHHIRLRVIGDRTHFSAQLNKAIDEAQNLTAQNKGLILNVAVNYSGRWDILQGVKKLCMRKEHAIPTDMLEEAFSSALSLYGLPEPDLFIRTGGVQRISNFMLWELAYTELYFTSTLWPDFNGHEFEKALTDFASRERRFGLTGEQLG